MKEPQKRLNSTLKASLMIGGLIVIVFSGCIYFALSSVKTYKNPKPLVINPSSVNNHKELSYVIYRALYPLAQKGHGVIFENKDEIPNTIVNALTTYFNQNKFTPLKFEFKNIKLTKEINQEDVDCETTALFKMNRKKRKWKKKIFFTVCKEEPYHYKIFNAL